ncbi:MAG: hypothetical protein LBS99_01415, partial [Clostridiales bacterium]|nr:hypothetical protein [Clostridiales bacterium]
MKARNKERKKLSATAFYIIALIILTVFLTVPFIATAYIVRYFSEEVFYEQQKSELLSYARILNTRLGPDGYEGILADAGKSGAEVTKEEKIKVLNEALTPDTDQIASASAGLGIGFYSRELDAILTYGPSADFLQTIGTPIGETHPGRTVMAADKEMVVIGTMVRGNIMNAMVPVVRHGEVIGYIWANQLVSALETALQNTANVIFSILVTAYVIILAVIVAFFLMIIRSEKKARAAVEASAEKALVATKAKSSFLASMSHEIRTPINAVIGMTTIGKTTADMEKAVRCFEKIEDASKHLLGVINDILDMSKIEA